MSSHLSWLVHMSGIPFHQALQSQAFNSFDIIHRLYLYSNIYSIVNSFTAVSEGVYVYNQCTIWLKGKFTYVVNNVYEDVDFIRVAWEIVKKPFCVRPNATFGRQLYALVHNVNSNLGNLECVIVFIDTSWESRLLALFVKRKILPPSLEIALSFFTVVLRFFIHHTVLAIMWHIWATRYRAKP